MQNVLETSTPNRPLPPVFDVTHKGRRYYYTGKFGHHMKTGEPAWEFAHRDREEQAESRLWIDANQTVTED